MERSERFSFRVVITLVTLATCLGLSRLAFGAPKYDSILGKLRDDDAAGLTGAVAGVALTQQLLVAGQSGIADTQASVVAQVGSNDTDIASLQSQVGSNDTDIASALAQIGSNDTEISSLQLQIGSNDTDISSALAQIGSNDTDIASLQAQVSSNDTDITTANGNISSLQLQVSSNDTDIASALAQIGSNDTDIASALAQIGSNDTDIASAFAQIGSNDTDIASLSLNSLTNVTVTSPSDGEPLVWDDASKQWTNGPILTTSNAAVDDSFLTATVSGGNTNLYWATNRYTKTEVNDLLTPIEAGVASNVVNIGTVSGRVDVVETGKLDIAGSGVLLTGLTHWVSFVCQDPTNSQIYWHANPFGADCHIAEVRVKSENVTGTVYILEQYWTNQWDNISGLIEQDLHIQSIPANDTSMSGVTVLTNDYNIGCVWSNLDALGVLNKIQVDIKLVKK